MKSLNAHLIDEGILDDIDTNIEQGDIDLENENVKHIKELLSNKNIYVIYRTFTSNEPLYTITKKGNKYIVDTNDYVNVTYYGGFKTITDGSFEFGNIGGYFSINAPGTTNFSSFKYGPHTVNGDCSIFFSSKLKDLKYCPKIVGNDFYVGETGITTLKYFPEKIGGTVFIVDNKQLNSLKDAGKSKIDSYVKIKGNGVSDASGSLKDLSNWNIRYRKESILEGTGMTVESILDDVEDTLSKGIEVIYPVPTIKDFEKTSFGAHRIKWFCKDLIQEYIKDLVPSSAANLFELNCICVLINKSKQVSFSLRGVNELGHVFASVPLAGIGGYTTDGLTKEKKYIIDLFKMLIKDPTKFKKLYELNNKNVELYRKHEYFEYIDTKEVINRLK